MNVLIVFAHPESRSFNGSMLEVAVKTLTDLGQHVKVSDLHKMNFNPLPGRHDFDSALSEDWFNYQDEQKHAHAQGAFKEDIKEEHEKLEWADLLLLQFPLWWFSMPAILKGWVDRVFAYGYAYGGGRWYDQGVFGPKRAMLGITVGGPETAYTIGGLQGDMEQILFPIQHGILQFVGFSVLPAFVAYSANYSDVDRRESVLDEFRKHLARIEALEPLPMPLIAEYDESLRRR